MEHASLMPHRPRRCLADICGRRGGRVPPGGARGVLGELTHFRCRDRVDTP